MDRLVLMQIHLDESRYRNAELEVLNAELEDRLNLTKRNYRIGISLALALTLWVGLSNIEYASQNRQLHELNQSRVQPLSTDELVIDLQYANEQLIEHCQPRNVNKAVNATPLPKLVKEV